MSLREKIISGLDEFPLESVKDILPEYWDIRVKLEELNETIGDHRARKDIGGNIGETLDRFVKDVDILKSQCSQNGSGTGLPTMLHGRFLI